MTLYAQKKTDEQRFSFGINWQRFLSCLDDKRIANAEQSLKQMLEITDLNGRTFIDVGSGSGLFSLAAKRLGARVYSFDYDPESVACTAELKNRYFPGDTQWEIQQGSALDRDYLQSLGCFDFVYSWGVLHHTGSMWQALENVVPLVAPQGKLFIAIYNDQGRSSRRWLEVKRAYNRLPDSLKFLVLWPAFARIWAPPFLKDMLRGKPGETWRCYAKTSRGMSPWRDVVDWVGGYPFEVATPEEIVDFYQKHGFVLKKLTTCKGYGCNEFVFIQEEARSCAA
ncbi:MAG: class I SAM-dependent methyltransferase [Nitrospirota bacterium]|nr:class I SAM-dependent methyltransferase [Nitrospirota bacterium]